MEFGLVPSLERWRTKPRYIYLFSWYDEATDKLGIVSRYDIATVPLHNVWSKFVAYSSSQNEQLLQALVTYQRLAESDPKSNLIFDLNGNTTVIGFLYAAHVASPAVFASFNSIPPLAVSSPATNSTVAGLSAHLGAMDPTVAAR